MGAHVASLASSPLRRHEMPGKVWQAKETKPAPAIGWRKIPPNDLTTADWMSRRAGQTTLVAGKRPPDQGTKGNGSAPRTICHKDPWASPKNRTCLPLRMANAACFFAPRYWKIDLYSIHAALDSYEG